MYGANFIPRSNVWGQSSVQYRREIDGLRSIAVLPVILFHAGVGLFSGGFVGVDIFFVISGYLITSILAHDLEAGKYSILKFYERRARRILPALFTVIVFTLPFSWQWMTPEQYTEYGQSIVSIVSFWSNIFYWLKLDYFAGSSELKPFLHTWSLAVEEQFYLFFPPVLAVLWRWRRRAVLPLLVVAGAASLALSEWASVHAESANFYLTPTRAWELFAGAICALLLDQRKLAVFPRNWLTEVGAGAGLGLVAYAILAFNDAMRFPGLSAAVPVVGTALIILCAGQGTIVARFLSLPPLVGIGLISYSAYLWHQPLFAFARLQSVTEPSTELMLSLALVSLVLATLSWRYVEQPFRVASQSFASTRKRVFLTSGLLGALLMGVGASIAAGIPATSMAINNPGILVEIHKRAYEPQGAYLPCPDFPGSTSMATCRRLGSGSRVIVIWGDSHANALSAAAYALPGYSIYIIGHWGCPAIIGVSRFDRFGNFRNCDTIGKTDMYARYAESLKPEKLFLISRWTMYANGRYFQTRPQRDSYLLTDGRRRYDTATATLSTSVMMAGIGRTIDDLRAHGAKVYIVQQVPDLHDYSPRGLLLLEDVPQAPITAWHASESRVLAQAVRHGAVMVPTHDLFCRAGRCQLRDGDIPLYIDDSHVNFYGASRVFKRIVRLAGQP